MAKVMINISQDSAVTQTVLGGPTVYPPVASFVQCIYATYYERRLAVDKVMAIIIILASCTPDI